MSLMKSYSLHRLLENIQLQANSGRSVMLQILMLKEEVDLKTGK